MPNLFQRYKAIFVLAIPIILPLVISFIHYGNLLASYQCILLGYPHHVERYCQSSARALAPGVRYEGTFAPALIDLSDFLGSSSTNSGSSIRPISLDDANVQWNEFGWKILTHEKGHAPIAILDYSNVQYGRTSPKDGPSAETSYGFRRNVAKTRRAGHSPTPIPLATIILMAMNIGMFLWLWNSRIDPSQVALNGLIHQDFGRAFTGSFSHFEIWHIAFNMMTLSNIGPSLERNQGSIPFFLSTISFVPLLTLVVAGLCHVHRQLLSTRQSATSFPSMVGFSGVLFAWIVVSTLDGQQSCPIFFLPSLCFDTWQLAGGLRVSLGPLVQLLFLQLVLPRVSFSGHLSGVLVGFLWHWKLLPSLEWFQPCVLFPILWIVCKYFLFERQGGVHFTQTVAPTWLGDNTWIGDFQAVLRKLSVVQIILLVHCSVQYFHIGVIFCSSTVSELLLVLILYSLLHVGQQYKNERRKVQFGVLGRAYIALGAVLLFTDGLTIGGWIVTWSMWRNASLACALLVTRDILLLLSLCLATRALNIIDETRSCEGTWAIIMWPTVQTLCLQTESIENLCTPPIPFLDHCRWDKRRNDDVLALQSSSTPDQNESTELV